MELYHNLHNEKLAKFLKQLEKHRVGALEKIARKKKNLIKESEVKCPIKSKSLFASSDWLRPPANHQKILECKKKFHLLPIDKKMRRKMKIKPEFYDQVGKGKEKVEVYGSHKLCRHIEEDHTVKGIRDPRTKTDQSPTFQIY